MKNMKRIQRLYWTQYGGLEKAWSSMQPSTTTQRTLAIYYFPVLERNIPWAPFPPAICISCTVQRENTNMNSSPIGAQYCGPMHAYNFEWLWDYLVHEHLYSLVQAYAQSVKNITMASARKTRNVKCNGKTVRTDKHERCSQYSVSTLYNYCW